MIYYSIGKFAKMIGKSVNTLRVWDERDIFKPHHVTTGGHRMYSEDQMQDVIGVGHRNQPKKRIVIGYCRVSTSKQKDDLNRQVELMQQYLIAQGSPFEIITDIGSGIHYRKKGLDSLISRIMNREVEKVVVLYKDRLVRFGWELIELVCQKSGTTLEVIDSTEKTEEQELVEDFIQIVKVFSCRLQGKRTHQGKKILKEVKILANNENSHTG